MNSKKDSAGMFKKLVQARSKDATSSPEPEDFSVPSEVQPKQPSEKFQTPSQTEPEPQQSPTSPESKKRGRPATGKRSDPDWIGRTYYIQKTTDLDVEEELLALKRQGVLLDKSDLVDALLGAWVKWRQGENAESQLGEISPRRN